MTSYTDKGAKPPVGHYFGFDHIEFWVGNAKQAASFYVSRFGFQPVAYRGLETGSRDVATHVVQQNKIFYAFSSFLNPDDSEIGRHVSLRGDGVRSIAFACDDAEGIYHNALKNGATPVSEPERLEDEKGSVIVASIATFDDTVHTFVQRNNYEGPFLPGFRAVTTIDPLCVNLPDPGLMFVDHCVLNHPDGKMMEVVNWYERILHFHRFWSVDDKMLHTKYSSLRSTVVADYDEVVKMPINEPAAGLRKSQIQEYVDYYGGSGTQHIAMATSDILKSIAALRARGVEFLKVPNTYYEDLKKRLSKSKTKITEDLEKLQSLDILVDFDEGGYLLQIFTKPVEDRPTLFYEVIQRHNHQGFGAGNFKSLFEAIERDQAERGNLM